MIRKGQVGRLVRLKENKQLMAIIAGRIAGDYGGIVLDRPLAGFRYWNAAELEYVPRTSPLRRYFKR